MNLTSIDIFCHVIDNFGDAGVVYRFARALREEYHQVQIRIFIDDPAPLHAIAPAIDPVRFIQEIETITVVNSNALTAEQVASLGVADIVVEAFACHIPECYLEVALFSSHYIINLEYLSAEPWVEEYHLKQSLLPRGTIKKYYFMPGFTTSTGGIILDRFITMLRSEHKRFRNKLLQYTVQSTGIDITVPPHSLIGTVFTYQRNFHALFTALTELTHPVVLLCFGEKTHRSILDTLAENAPSAGASVLTYRNCTIILMPFIAQQEYDRLLCCTEFNIVRGEDSLVRAILAAKPFIWNAYLQDEKYQKVKVEAFATMMQEYFDDREIFEHYRNLLMHFNDAPEESVDHRTDEDFTDFFRNLKKIEHSTRKLCYFIEQNCNLAGKFSDFIKTL